MLINVSPKAALRIVPHLLFYLRSQHWSPERLGRYQDDALRRLIRHAGRHVPYYRELFGRIGLDPAAFRGRADLHRIPLLDKETVRTRGEELVADNAADFDPTWSRTSGSTGTPLRFALGAACRASDAAATLRSYLWAGFVPGMRVFTLKWYMSPWEYRYGMAGRALDADTMKLSPDSARRLWGEVNRLRPSVFHGYPFAMIMLAKLARDAGIAHHCPKVIITIAESLPPGLRRQLSAAYGGARVFDFYSMTEDAVLITECRHGSMHVLDDYACHEFVDEQGRPVASGRGEIVGTGYYNYAMPLIRYRTRDFALLPGQQRPCACGRPFRTVESIEGRKEDFVQTPDGKLLNLFEEPLNEARGIMAGQFVQDEPDHLYVNILPGPDFVPESLRDVERELRRRVGEAMRIDFRVVAELERRPGESGKVPFLISRIGNRVAGRTQAPSP
jgi:phenylacetate-CoA ligase